MFKFQLNIFGRLDGSFRQAIAGATSGLKNIQNTAVNVKQAFLDVAQAAGTAMAVRRFATAAGDVETQLVRIGNTADMSNNQLAALRDRVRETSTATGQSMGNLLSSFEILVSKGMANDTASEMLASIGKVATASHASVEDLSATVFSLNQNLGIKPESMGDALNMLTLAGKQGAFELKDMAQYFPMLTAQAQKLGLQGKEAIASLGASLQVGLIGAADPAEAANNMANFLKAMASPTVQENFKKHGVNLSKLLADSINSGKNPIEAVLEKTDKMLGSDQGQRVVRMGMLFNDAQAQNFLTPMLANMKKYNEIKNETLSGKNVVDKDFARVMATYDQTAAGASNEIGKLSVAIGKALLPPLTAFLQAVTPIIKRIADLIEKAPTLTLAITALGSAMLVVLPAIRLVGVALRLLNIAKLFTPWGIAAAVVVTAVSLIIDNWDWLMEKGRAVVKFFTETWDAIKSSMSGLFGLGSGIKMPSVQVPSVAPAGLYGAVPGMSTGINSLSGSIGIYGSGFPQGTRISARSETPGVDFNLLSGPIGVGAN